MPIHRNPSILGAKVFAFRRSSGMTQPELAQEVRMSLNTIQQLEKGTLRQVKSDVLERLATHFKCTTDYLLGRNAERGNSRTGVMLDEY